MLGYLIRKEMLDQILSLRFLILSAIGTLVILLSLYSGYIHYQNRLSDYRVAQAATEDRIREINVAENWSEFVAKGYEEHIPPTPMSIFIRGLELNLGRSIANTFTRRLSRSPAEVKPLLAIFPPLDLGLVVQVVLSLFVLLFTYDAICGEKEVGTLRLMASFSVPRHRLLLGKFIGALLPTLSAFGLPLLLGIAVVLLMPEVQFTNAELHRLGFILASFGLYLTVFTCAGLLASCLTHRAPTSFVLLLGFWVATVVVLPRLSLIGAESIRPAPSVYELEAEKGAISKSIWEEVRRARYKWRDEYNASSEKKWRQTPEGQEAERLHYRGLRHDLWLVPTRLEYERLEQAFRNRYNARLELAVVLARFSPAFAVNNATVRLARTGLDRQQRFRAAYEPYYREHYTWFIDSVDDDRLRQINPARYGKFKWDISNINGSDTFYKLLIFNRL